MRDQRSNTRSSARHQWRNLVVARDRQEEAREHETGVRAREAGMRTYAERLNELSRGYRPTGLFWEVLREHVDAETTAIDVGAGVGRHTLPLAGIAASVVAVEPSSLMAGYLRENLVDLRIENVRVLECAWESAQLEPADVVLCSHVLYEVADVGAFLGKLDAHAKRLCLIVHNLEQYDPLVRELWLHVFREEREPLPAFADLLAVLDEMGLRPAGVGRMEPPMRLSFGSLAEAVEYGADRLALPRTEESRRPVEDFLRQSLEPKDGRLYGPPSPAAGVVWWLK